MKKKTAKPTPQPPSNTEKTEQTPKPRHPDADYIQKTTFGYIGAYA